jgi:hypothetical protein
MGAGWGDLFQKYWQKINGWTWWTKPRLKTGEGEKMEKDEMKW